MAVTLYDRDGNAITFASADFAQRGHQETITGLGVTDQRFIVSLQASAINAGAAFIANSTDSVTLGTGSRSFTIEKNKPFFASAWLRIEEDGTPSNYMEGTVTSYDPDTGALTVNVLLSNGSGTISDWKLLAQGRRGEQGTGGVDVDDGSTSVQSVTGITFANSLTVTDDGDGTATVDSQTDLVGDTSPQLGGALDANGNPINMSGEHIASPTIEAFREHVVDHGTVSSDITLDVTNGNVHTLVLAANVTITLSWPDTVNNDELYSIFVVVTQDGTGGHTPTFATDRGSIRWEGGTVPVASTGANESSHYSTWVYGASADTFATLAWGD